MQKHKATFPPVTLHRSEQFLIRKALIKNVLLVVCVERAEPSSEKSCRSEKPH